MADDEEAIVYKLSILCSGFASISGITSGKSEVHTIRAVATPLNTCRASRACRGERVVSCCPTNATHVRYDFFLCQNTRAIWRVVSLRDATI